MSGIWIHAWFYLWLAIPGAILAAIVWYLAARIRSKPVRMTARAALVGFSLAPTKALVTDGIIAPANVELFFLLKELFLSGPGFLKEGGLFPLLLAGISIAGISLFAAAAIQLYFVFSGRLPGDADC